MKELWKEIEGTNGQYLFQNMGRVRSLGNTSNRKEKIFKKRNVYTLTIDKEAVQYSAEKLFKKYFPEDLVQKKIIISYEHLKKSKTKNEVQGIPDGITQIPGYDSYYATPDGNVYSKQSNGVYFKHIPHSITSIRGEYYTVKIEGKSRMLNRVIARTFITPTNDCPMLELDYSKDNRVVDHIDGNTLNNNYKNLQILSQSENIFKSDRKNVSDEWTATNISTGEVITANGSGKLLALMGEDNNNSNRVGLSMAASGKTGTFKKKWKIIKKNIKHRPTKVKTTLTDSEGNITTFNSIADAARYLEVTPAHLNNVINLYNDSICRGYTVEIQEEQ